MAVVTYCLIVTTTGLCTDKFRWDDAFTYTPASGYSLAPNANGEVGWTWNSGTSTWSPPTVDPPFASGTPSPTNAQYLDTLFLAADDLILGNGDLDQPIKILPRGSALQYLRVSASNQLEYASFNESVDDRVAQLLVAGSGVTLTYDDAGNTLTIASSGGVSDGDKGDITVSTSGATWTIDAGAVSTSKLGGDITAAGKALLDDADAAAQRVTLGLGTAALEGAGYFAQATHTHAISDVTNLQTTLDGKASSSHTHTAANITDFSEAVDDEVASLLVAGSNITLTYNDSSNTLTIAAAGTGGVADGDKGDITVSASGATWTIDNGVVGTAKLGGDITTAGKALLDDADAAAQRTTLGLGTAATLNVGTSANNVVQLNGSGQLPAVSGALLTNLPGGSATVTTYTSGSGNWTVPSSGSMALVRAWGAGGSGGRGGSTSTRGCGGGGGGYTERLYLLSSLGSAGASIAYSVGAGGTAVSAAGVGNPGGNTTFASSSNLLTAYGGGGGHGNATTSGGGGGGGSNAAGSNGAFDSGGAGGAIGGGDGSNNSTGGAARTQWGGGGGGFSTGGGSSNGGGAAFLGGGGGAGGGGGSGVGGTSILGGSGGNGSNVSGTPGGTGTAPGGGGGGQSANGGSSGAGANGRIEIWVW